MASPEQEGKTEEPTTKRLKEAQQEGKTAKSPDLVSWFSLFAAFSVIESTFKRGSKLLNDDMAELGQLIAKPDANKALLFMVESLRDGLLVVLPLTLVFMILAIIGFLAQSRMKLATKALKPNFKSLNPLPGIKRMFSPKSAMQALKQSLKLIVISVLAYMTIYRTIHALLLGGPYPIGELLAATGKATASFVKQAAFLAFLVGILDYVWQRRQTKNSLKMTKQEVKDESKQQELPAEVRAKIRMKQRQLSRNRMMSAIRDADVVVVNPVHIAMALQYDPEKGAPKVVAKGAGFVAEKIKAQANDANVPMVVDVPLARALHASCDIDDEIPLELFEAVAKVLAFVFGLKRRGFAQGVHNMPGTPDVSEADRLEAEHLAKHGESLAAKRRREKAERLRKERRRNHRTTSIKR